ncbi:hypothetical protein [Viridibacterium curvum]|uniref:Pteridine-dependent deoxygenase n=1 Tax=Viridibacterium curvum TaxID=1101404 RepID=A0ABP9QZV2_9RHOO
MGLFLRTSGQGGLAATDPASLCVVWHGSERAPDALRADVHVRLQALRAAHEGAGVAEYWTSDARVQTVRHGQAVCKHDGEWMWVALDTASADAADIATATRHGYDALFAAMQREDFPYLVRCWNYVPHINADQMDDQSGERMERYRLFNRARQEAFQAARQAFEVGAPAACALGSHEGSFTLYALAARRAPRCIENPRQISAYNYPVQYGPRSPSFSRAAVMERSTGDSLLFVSGTASIVGHESLHPGDVAAQTEESLRNIRAVMSQANATQTGSARFDMSRLQYKTFVRHARDAAAVEAVMRRELGSEPIIHFLLADVCRAELLVEIEAVGAAAAGTGEA